jgi:iron complex outermembrane recepter protein
MSFRHFPLPLFLFLTSSLYGQHVLRGNIVDNSNHKPLSNVSIYLPEIHRGSYTDSTGHFIIRNIPAQRILLEISHLGYQTQFSNIEFPADSTMLILAEPSFIPIQEVVVTGIKNNAPDETSFNIVQIGNNEINATTALSLSDAISKVPGVNQLSTGPGISKPVIRGLYGNRIQINMNGIRFDNQQWQDEHGLGLSTLGIDRVEIIRGPASVLYGSDAMGGVINIIKERPAFTDQKIKDLNARVFANTYGLSLNYGAAQSNENSWRQFRVGFDNHADYNTGGNTRVLNSRFVSYNAQVSWGVNRKNGVHVWSLLSSHSLFGFVFDSLSRKENDGRLSRNFDGPHHSVSFAQITNENIYYRGKNKINLNTGFISNLRLEDEGGGGISLSMLLNTINATAQIFRPTRVGDLTTGVSGFVQTNTNFGGRIIIPDAINTESSLFSFYQKRFQRWLIEGGVRYDNKFIQTFSTGRLNTSANNGPSEEIFPFSKFYHAYNLSAGTEYFVNSHFTVKGNISSGYRPGNLAELSSNGLHEGTLRWEIGIPNAKIEQNLNLEGSLNFHSPYFRSSVSYFQNDFKNFFYLSPDGTEFFGFQVYHFRQSNALLTGGEFEFVVSPAQLPMSWKGSYSLIEAQKNDGSYLPFIPANKLASEVEWRFNTLGKIKKPELKVAGVYSFAQVRPAEFETNTNSYFLLNATISVQYHSVNWSLSGNNLLNKNYYDHLSRYKYYGIANMGRSVVLIVNTKF